MVKTKSLIKQLNESAKNLLLENKEIVNAYKAGYNYLSRGSEYIMYTGMFIVILSIINYIMQNIAIFIINGSGNLSYYLNFDIGLISQFSLLVFVILGVTTYIKKERR